jgi:hypothetical protein
LREEAIMKASVRVMLSHDYNHFEVALSSDEEMHAGEVNELRKTAQRLADEAVRQYKVAKEAAARREKGQYAKQSFLQMVHEIQGKSEADRSIEEIAILKQYDDEEWEAQFDYRYDYDDDSDFIDDDFDPEDLR